MFISQLPPLAPPDEKDAVTSAVVAEVAVALSESMLG
jgi:hypothetical protein